MSAVKHLHDNGIAHRDLKVVCSMHPVWLLPTSPQLQPENFLCVDKSPSPRVKLIDFGFAKTLADGLQTPVYTPYYVGSSCFAIVSPVTCVDAAPEILSVRAHASKAYFKECDIWSLGVMLYIM